MKIIVIATYFGRWPVWFPAFMLSCARNEAIHWLFFTDCRMPEASYKNIRFESMNLDQFNELASQKLGIRVEKEAYSHVDLQPAYGFLFEEYLSGYDFWGHCDIDVVWGDIGEFITENILASYDIVSSRKDFLAGHLTLWRNRHEINTLFRSVPGYRRIFASPKFFNFDEAVISTFLKMQMATGDSEIRVYWPKQMVCWFRGDTTPVGWCWDRGRIFDANHQEHVYIHFQHWKQRITYCDFKIGETPATFEFTQDGIRSGGRSVAGLLRQRSVRDDLKETRKAFAQRATETLRLAKRLSFTGSLFWSRELAVNSINAKDAHCNRVTGELRLLRLGVSIAPDQRFLLAGYYAALHLVERRGAKFLRYQHEELIVEVAGLRASIRNVEEIVILKRLLVDGLYDVELPPSSVVLDMGMHVGLTSIVFASKHDTVVIGYEPCQLTLKQAHRNFTLNPTIATRIHTNEVAAGVAKYRTIAGYLNEETAQNDNASICIDKGMGPKFEYEEVDVADVAELVDSIVASYPGHEITVKIDLECPDYYIDGITESQIISRLAATCRLSFVTTVMLKWYKRSPSDTPVEVKDILTSSGYSVFQLAPFGPDERVLYAVRKGSQGVDTNERQVLMNKEIVHEFGSAI